MEKDEQYYSAYLAHNQISRRSLLRCVFAASPLQKSGERRQANRPPFAANESIFLAICNGCGECVKACRYGLIELQDHYPVLDLQFSACDFCGACAKACPTHVLHSAFKADTALRPKILSSCLRQQGQVCTTCEQACSTKALTFVEQTQRLSVDPHRCRGCGACQTACFMQAIVLENRDQSE